MKKFTPGVNGSFEMAEERINELEDSSIEIVQFKKQKEKKKNK